MMLILKTNGDLAGCIGDGTSFCKTCIWNTERLNRNKCNAKSAFEELKRKQFLEVIK
jgi:hypothetical protein